MHFYNCPWRLLGEHNPHRLVSAEGDNVAGTHYWAAQRTWHHLDHVIVSGGLLGATVPFLDEENVGIICSQEFLQDGVPTKFSERSGDYIGLSDHLPIYAKLITE